MAAKIDKGRMSNYEQFLKEFNSQQSENAEKEARYEQSRVKALEERAKKIKRRVNYVWRNFDDDSKPVADANTLETDTKAYVTPATSMSRCSSMPESSRLQRNIRTSSTMASQQNSLSMSLHGRRPTRSLTRRNSSPSSVILANGWTAVGDDDDDVPKFEAIDRLLPPHGSQGGCFGHCKTERKKDSAVEQQEWETFQINVIAASIYVVIMIWYLQIQIDFDLASLLFKRVV